MIKKIFYLVVISSMLSSGLLYLGITLMSHYSPAHASSMEALVAETSDQNSTDLLLLGNTSSTNDSTGLVNAPNPSTSKPGVSTSGASSIPSQSNSVDGTSLSSNQTAIGRATSSTKATQASSITIAELIRSPKEFEDVVFTISGIATVLNHEKFLLNDGTGQILVEVEDEFISLEIINGLSVTVIGELDEADSAMTLEFDACSLNYQNENIIFDDCVDDDDDMDEDDDDMEDDPDDDLDDDMDNDDGTDHDNDDDDDDHSDDTEYDD